MTIQAKRASRVFEAELSASQRAILDRFRLRAAEHPGTVFDELSMHTAWPLHRLDFESKGRPESVLQAIEDVFADEWLCSIGVSLGMVYLLWSVRHRAGALQTIEAFLPERGA